jgi:tetratricopeptide (TPR) repeat protein
MSDFRQFSMVRLIHWLVIRNGFTEDQAEAIIEKLRAEIIGSAARREGNGKNRPGAAEILTQVFTGVLSGGIVLWADRLLTNSYDDKESRSHAEIYYEIGNVYLQEGALDRAIEEYGRAIELNPNYAEAFNSRGMAYGLKGQNDQAISDFDKAIKLNPKDFAALSNRGNAFNAEGRYDRADLVCVQLRLIASAS